MGCGLWFVVVVVVVVVEWYELKLKRLFNV